MSHHIRLRDNDDGGSDELEIVKAPTTSAWRQRVRLALEVGCTLLFCAVVAALVAHCVSVARRNARADADKQLDWWLKHSARLERMRNPDVKPCDDFYEHVCGGWLAATEIPGDASSVGSFDAIAVHINGQLEAIAQQGWPFVGTYYDSCMDTEARAHSGLSALEPLEQLVGAFAVNDTCMATGLLHMVGARAFFSLYVAPDDRDPTRPAVMVGHPSMGAPPSVWNGTGAVAMQQRAALTELVTRLLGADDAERALRVEREWLAPLQLSPTQLRGRGVEWIPVAELGTAPFNWTRHLALAFGAEHVPSHVGTYDPGYVRAVFQHTDHSGADLRAYLRYQLALAYVDAYPNATDLLAPLRLAQTGAVETLAHECLSATEWAFGPLMSHYYVRRFFSPDAKAAALLLVHQVVEAFGERLRTVSWLDDVTRSRALAKLSELRVLIGYPDMWDDTVPPEEIYRDDFLGNQLRHTEWSVATNWAVWTNQIRLDGPPSWDMNAFTVNAYFDPLANDIVFPAGILTGVFFNESAPLAANFGGIGMVMGHEITHGYDDEGRQYDASGARRDWWTPEASAAFDERAQCVVDLYSGYETPYGRVDGRLTEGENLADMGGLGTAYQAYLNTLDLVPNVGKYKRAVEYAYSMTDRQLFFVSWASVWCTKRTPQRATQLLHMDPHSPPRWRINGPASQSREFAQVFGCRVPDNQTVCSVW